MFKQGNRQIGVTITFIITADIISHMVLKPTCITHFIFTLHVETNNKIRERQLFYLIGICGKIFLSDKDNIFALLAYGAKQNWWLRFWSTISIYWRKYGPHTIINRVSAFLCYLALIWPAIQRVTMSTVCALLCLLNFAAGQFWPHSQGLLQWRWGNNYH